MILYRPTDGDAHTAKTDYRPKTCFLMTQLGEPVPDVVREIRTSLGTALRRHRVRMIDARSVVTGKDFLLKICQLLYSVPLGVAAIDSAMSPETLGNIFYELGVMQAYGKETIIIKSRGTAIPTDFVRTEYIEYGPDFEEEMERFLVSFLHQAEYYSTVADQIENNPVLAIDYLRRAYLISGRRAFKTKAKAIFDAANFGARARNSVETLLVNF